MRPQDILFEEMCAADLHQMELEAKKTLLFLQLDRYKTNFQYITKYKATICPHCAQVVTPEEIMSRMTRLREEIPRLDEPIRQAKKAYETVAKKWRKIATFDRAGG